MKTHLTICIVFLSAVFTSCSAPFASYYGEDEPQGSVTFQVFYSELSPYGSWMQYGAHGYVWTPAVSAGFAPYSTNGHWVFTDFGWTWVSGYRWGWAPFHYGRWLYDDFYGWMWVPGYDWAPAWVVWGQYDYYYGWAPIAPGITVIAGYRPPPHYWFYCPSRYIADVRIHRHIVTRNIPADRVALMDNTAGGNYHYGPRREAVEKASGKPVNRVAVVEKNSPAPSKLSGNRLEVYRPAISKGEAAPPKVVTPDEMKQKTPARKQTPERDADNPVYWNRPAEKKTDAPAERKIQPEQKQPPRKNPDMERKAPLRERRVIEKQTPRIQKRIEPPPPKRIDPPAKTQPRHVPRHEKQRVTPRPQPAPKPMAPPKAPPPKQAAPM